MTIPCNGLPRYNLSRDLNLNNYVLDRFYCAFFRETELLKLMLLVMKKHLRGTSLVGRDVGELAIRRVLITLSIYRQT